LRFQVEVAASIGWFSVEAVRSREIGLAESAFHQQVRSFVERGWYLTKNVCHFQKNETGIKLFASFFWSLHLFQGLSYQNNYPFLPL
jgi:hypothetical protein